LGSDRQRQGTGGCAIPDVRDGPQQPRSTRVSAGGTLGSARKHWFRAKFGNGRFRLFFRYDSRSKVIIFSWVNDDTTLRTYGSKTDAYAVFKGMLDNGNPPDDWAALLKAASANMAHHDALQRMADLDQKADIFDDYVPLDRS
jgi:toxin YhaV